MERFLTTKCSTYPWEWYYQYSDVIVGAMGLQITSLPIVYSIIYSGAEQRKHQSSTPLAFVWGIHRWPVNSSQVNSSQNIFIQEVHIHIKYIGKTEAQWAYLSHHSWNWIWYIITSILASKQNRITGVSIGVHFNNVCHFRFTRLSCVPKIETMKVGQRDWHNIGIQQYSHTINQSSNLLLMHKINCIKLDNCGTIVWKYVYFVHSSRGQV